MQELVKKSWGTNAALKVVKELNEVLKINKSEYEKSTRRKNNHHTFS